jgi:hypothetical protein
MVTAQLAQDQLGTVRLDSLACTSKSAMDPPTSLDETSPRSHSLSPTLLPLNTCKTSPRQSYLPHPTVLLKDTVLYDEDDDDDMLPSPQQAYDQDTWRLYHRIQVARQTSSFLPTFIDSVSSDMMMTDDMDSDYISEQSQYYHHYSHQIQREQEEYYHQDLIFDLEL